MWQTLWKRIRQHTAKEGGRLMGVSIGVAGCVVMLKLAGAFQFVDLLLLDYLFRWKPHESVDSRIVIVAIGETDLNKVGQWPIPDGVLAELLQKVQAQRPRVVGMDIYRNLPVEPGRQRLAQVFSSFPELIGIEKVAGNPVGPSPILARLNQVAFSDMVLDKDGSVRRALIAMEPEAGQLKVGLATRLGLNYLAKEGIQLQSLDGSGSRLKLGKVTFEPLQPSAGGYVNADMGGYQILHRFRGTHRRFQVVSMSAVLEGQIPPDQMRDRIVLIGSTAESLRDYFQTPFGQMAGVVIHANLVSQILSSALDGRTLLKPVPKLLEWFWIWAWSLTGTVLFWRLLQARFSNRLPLPLLGLGTTGVTVGSLGLVTYLFFLGGFWIPMAPPLVALSISSLLTTAYYSQKVKRLATLDSLTKVANRRAFDEFLLQESAKPGCLSLILCDVDYFKVYNDTYGHQAGDECLKQVAEAIQVTVRRTDLVARYGGEEFAVVLPQTDAIVAAQIADRIVQQVRETRLLHAGSSVGPYVTLSCGVASILAGANSGWLGLIARADAALYTSKENGRDRFTVAS